MKDIPLPFQLIDVFGAESFQGNPVAVVFAPGAPAELMQQIARWLNLSETVFVMPPTCAEADYRVRIFTLDRELPFAGHPTLGACRAWLRNGGVPRTPGRIVQECGIGLVPVRETGGHRLAFAAPPMIRTGPVAAERLEEIVRVLGIDRAAVVDAHWVDNGPGWVALLLRSAEAVLAVDPARSHPERLDIGLVGPYPPGAPAAFELRAIFSDHQRNLVEDPVTGSLNAAVAQWLLGTGRATAPYVASQGARVGRAGRVYVERDAEGAVWVGGAAVGMFGGSYWV